MSETTTKFIEQDDADWIQNVLLASPRKLESFIESIDKGRYVMFVGSLDDHCKRTHGYTESEHGSLRSFCGFKFGEEGLKRITRLCNIKE